MPSNDVKEMRKLVSPLTSSASTDQERSNLSVLLMRMYTDLDKTVRRCDESGRRSKSTIRVGSAATAASSAVAGTTLVSGSTGTAAIVVGVVTVVLGVLGSVVAALRLSDSITQNQSDHARYLPLLRELGTFAAVDLFSASIADIRERLDKFAADISAIEAEDAAAAAGPPIRPSVEGSL
jgi:hypothetical protein